MQYADRKLKYSTIDCHAHAANFDQILKSKIKEIKENIQINF
jgi:hypothetical protein